MAGAALVQRVCATTPAATQKLARRPSTNGAELRGMPEPGRSGSRAAGYRRAPLVIALFPVICCAQFTLRQLRCEPRPELAREAAASRRVQVKVLLASASFFDRLDAIGIKSEITLDGGNGRVRFLVGPNGIDRALPADRNAEISAVALVGAVGGVIRPLEQREVDVLPGNVLDRRVGCLSERQGVARVGDHPPGNRDHHPVWIAF